MIDISADISGALQQISGVTVYYFAPSEWTSLPAVSWFEVKNAEYARSDGQENLSDIAYRIDVWSDGQSTNALTAIAVDSALSALGLKRQSSADTVDGETGLFHRTMQYGCIADENKNIFQKNNQ